MAGYCVLNCSLGELCVKFSMVQPPDTRSALTLVSSRAAGSAKRYGHLHSFEKLSSSKEELNSCEEDIDSGDEGGVRKTGKSLRAAEILS